MNFIGDTVVAFPGRKPNQIGFARDELTRILDLYGRMLSTRRPLLTILLECVHSGS